MYSGWQPRAGSVEAHRNTDATGIMRVDVHLTVLGADRYGLRTCAACGRIPSRGATLVVGLIPWREGSGGPCRAFASV